MYRGATTDLIAVNKWSRPGYKLQGVKFIAMHWVGGNGKTAQSVRDFFDSRKNGTAGYGSTHFSVGVEGESVQCIPLDEVAYQVGHSDKKDPASGRYYTDFARELLGEAACNQFSRGPNDWGIGIELCHPDMTGKFTSATVNSAVMLVANLCIDYHSDPLKSVCTHHQLVGWKDCPRWWVQNPELFDAFRHDVNDAYHGMLQK